MTHRWNGKITKRVRFVTCVRCGMIKETSMMGYVYYPPGADDAFYDTAQECKNNIPKGPLEDVKFMTRDEVVPYYAELIKQTSVTPNDSAVLEMNNKILSKWSAAGLEYIKDKAWAIVGWK